ncbi:MAG: hypothetical protein JRN67_06055, partial [Nitrososphaerota archaeon]|nr:hypothetical protein [Nitrososphaerota archaeon]
VKLREKIPAPWEKQVNSFSKKYDLPLQLGEPMFDSERRELFEQIVGRTKLSARFVASFLIDSLLALSRSGVDTSSLNDRTLLTAFEALDVGRFAKEALPEILRQISTDQTLSFESALSRTGLDMMKASELERIIDAVIEENTELVQAKGTGAHSILMGKVMQKVRGKAEGKIVNDTLAKRLASKGKS